MPKPFDSEEDKWALEHLDTSDGGISHRNRIDPSGGLVTDLKHYNQDMDQGDIADFDCEEIQNDNREDQQCMVVYLTNGGQVLNSSFSPAVPTRRGRVLIIVNEDNSDIVVNGSSRIVFCSDSEITSRTLEPGNAMILLSFVCPIAGAYRWLEISFCGSGYLPTVTGSGSATPTEIQ